MKPGNNQKQQQREERKQSKASERKQRAMKESTYKIQPYTKYEK